MPTILDEQFDQIDDLMLVTSAKNKPAKMKPPDNGRRVLTLARDSQGLVDWQIDNFVKPDIWIEAHVWGMTVLYWQELPPKPEYKEME